MKAYLCVFRIRFISVLQYRAAAFSSMGTGLLWGFMELLAFAAFYRANPAAFPMPFEQLASYIWLQEGFITLFSLTNWDNDCSNAIESGAIAYELARPIDLYNRWFCQSMGNRLAKGLMRGTLIFVIAFFLPSPYRMLPPAGVCAFLQFVISLPLAMAVVTGFSMLMYIAVFSLLSSRGIKLVFGLIADFLSGGLIPLPFFPESIRKILELTPFGAMQNLPLRIYGGNIAGAQAWKGILMQIFWILALYGIGKLCMRRALKRVIVQGG